MGGSAKPTPVCQQDHEQLPSDLRRAPSVAWPTLLLAAFGLGLFAATHYWLLFKSGAVSVVWSDESIVPFLPSGVAFAPDVAWFDTRYLCAVAALSLAAYVSFTPMHDAAHKSICRGRGMLWVNDFVGHASGLALAAPFHVFKHLHLEHHKYTNYPEHDPDMWVSGGAAGYSQLSAIFLPFRCMTIVWVGYVGHYSAAAPTRPLAESIPGISFLGLFKFLPLLSPLVLPAWSSYLLWGFLLPTEIAAAFLGLAFDYLPHRPSEDTALHLATSVVSLVKDTQPLEAEPTAAFKLGTSVLTPFLLYQNYHLVHHLYPFLPFYHYSRVYWRLRVAFNKRGHEARTLFPLVVLRKSEAKAQRRFR